MAEKKPVESTAERRYFIVNPAGAVHEVTREHAKDLLRRVGYRMATADEAKVYLGAPEHRGLKPVAEKYEPEKLVDAALE